jgi:hypothetical protein
VLHGNIHRHLLILSIANWVIAIVCWSVSAYLGIAVPTSIFIYAILFVVGLFAVVVAVASYLLADFGVEPQPVVAASGPPDGAATAVEPEA